MKPSPSSSSVLDRRALLALGAAAGLSALTGCTTPLLLGQSPDEEIPLDEKKRELVGDFTRPWGLNWVKLESVALVTNLANTGSDPPPSSQRMHLIGEMQSHEVRNPDTILASPTTSMVLVEGYLPPAVQKGDTFDVQIRLPSRSETTSLRGGWLMPTRMRQMEVLGGSIRSGGVDALAQGDLVVDALFNGEEDKVLDTRARVLGGGVSMLSRDLGLAISRDDASIRTSTIMSAAINNRFYTFDAGTKKGVANPQRDNYIKLAVSPRYKHNLARYLRVVRNIAVRENPVERTERMQLLEKKLLEPITAATAALQLEAIGAESVPILKKGLVSTDAEVRFYAAEALAYLDEAEAAPILADAARNESAFRWHALTALTAMDHVAAYDALSGLLHVESIETRYGAFRAIRSRNANDPATKGEALDKKFRYHVISSTGQPLIHLTRSRLPEVVLFGHEQKLKTPKFLFAGKQIMITGLESGELKIGRFRPDQETQYETCSADLDKVIRTIVKLGGGYPEVIEFLNEARKAGCLDARIAVEALPKPDRKYFRDDDPLPEAPIGEEGAPQAPPALATRRAATPAPEFFTDGIEAAEARDEAEEDSKAGLGETFVAPEHTEPKKGFFGKLMPSK